MLWILIINPCSATDEILDVQAKNTGVYIFLNEANKYVKSAFPEMNLVEMLNNSIKGNINYYGFWGIIIDLFGDELLVRNCKYGFSFNYNSDT